MHTILQDDLYADELQSHKLAALRQRDHMRKRGKKKAKRMSVARRVSAPMIRKRFNSDVASSFMKDFLEVYSQLDKVEALDMRLLYQESTHRKEMSDRPNSGLDAILQVSKEMFSPKVSSPRSRKDGTGSHRADVIERRHQEEEEERRRRQLLVQQDGSVDLSAAATDTDNRALRLQGMSYGEVLQHQGHALRRVREDDIDYYYREKVAGITLMDKTAALEDQLHADEGKEFDGGEEADPALYLGWREKAKAAAEVESDGDLGHEKEGNFSPSEIVQDRCTLFQMLEIIDDCAVQMLEASKAVDAKARQNMDMLRARSQRGCDDILATMRGLTAQDEEE